MGEQDRRLDQELRDLLTPLGVVSTPVGEESIQPFTVMSLYDKRDRQLWDLLSQHLLPLMAHYGESLTWEVQEVCNEHWLRSELERERFVKQLSQAHLIVIGMSSDLIATLYEEGVFLCEWLKALRQPYPAQPSPLLPVMLRAVSLKHVPLVMRKPVPRKRLAIAGARDRDDVCVEVVNLIEQEIETTWAWYRPRPPRQQTVWFCETCRTMRVVLQDRESGVILCQPSDVHRQISPDCQDIIQRVRLSDFESSDDLRYAALPDWVIGPLIVYLGFT